MKKNNSASHCFFLLTLYLQYMIAVFVCFLENCALPLGIHLNSTRFIESTYCVWKAVPTSRNLHSYRKKTYARTQENKYKRCKVLWAGKGENIISNQGVPERSTGDHLEEWAEFGQDRREQYKQGQQWETTVHVQKTISNLSAAWESEQRFQRKMGSYLDSAPASCLTSDKLHDFSKSLFTPV